jgi:D-arabinose 1-dehydrogenase-like Zn-dependent alcohol dehydrogenase
MLCENQPISGISFDGGYADYVLTPANALALLPDGLADADAGPLLCAGVTTFNSLRNSGARPGDTVAVLGMGGLGHLAIQYAAKSGFRTVAIARGADKGPLAHQLGAHLYIDSTTQDPAAELRKIGGTNLIVSTITSAKALEWTLDALAPSGKLLVLGAPEDGAIQVNPFPLLLGRRTVAGWPSGTGMDSEDTLNFSVLTGVRPMIETYPLEKAEDAYQRMMSGKARFRVVLKIGA